MKKLLIPIVIVVLVVSGFFYKKSLKNKVITPPIQVVANSKPIELKTKVSEKNSLNQLSVIRFTNNKIKTSVVSIAASSKFFTKENFEIHFSESTASAANEKPGEWNGDIGIGSLVLYYKLLEEGNKLAPIFEAMVSKTYPICYNNFNAVVKSDTKLNGFNDLSGKSIAFLKTGSAISKKVFFDDKIKFRKVYIANESNIDWAINALTNGTIDALMDTSFDNGPVKNFKILGHYKDDKFLKYENLKILATRNLNIPCAVIFVNLKKVKPDVQKRFIEILKKAMLTVSPNEALANLGGIYGVKEIPEENLLKFNKMFIGVKKDLKSAPYADELIPIMKVDKP
ncbi:MAG: ABC transporter substrate-binding protein [Rhizobacter sp.]|nr:ABC transporter substrate-binding protein [Bacteriovorax sp.]